MLFHVDVYLHHFLKILQTRAKPTMLWEKESKKSNALYVNIFAPEMRQFLNDSYEEIQSKVNCLAFEKNDKVSLKKRREGNALFGQREWSEAMERYNESLCFAAQGSKNVGWAYANRSACFFNMKKYKECLVDIELAKSGGYSDCLIPKLDERKIECLKRIEEDPQSSQPTVKLSFEPHKDFPCMANVLEIKRSGNGNYAVVAKEDIGERQTIMIDKPYLSYLYKRYGSKCSICLKDETNLVPCKKCAIAMFCSDECHGSFLHEHECGRKICDDDELNGRAMQNVRGILMAINMFSSVDELMSFVEQAIDPDSKDLPDSLVDMTSQYKVFLKLRVDWQFIEALEFAIESFSAYKFLLSNPQISTMFKTKKHRRFLMNLVGHHTQIIEYNASASNWGSVRKQGRELNVENKWYFYRHVELMRRYFNQSCHPNVFHSTHGNTTAYFTTQPIAKGQQVFIPYAPLNPYAIACECSKCSRFLSPAREFSRRSEVSDEDIQGFCNIFFQLLGLNQ